LLVSLGVNGKLVIGAPQPLQVQLPATFGFSPAGASDDVPSEGEAFLLLAKQALQVRPLSLRGSNGSWVIAPPHLLQVQLP
jgi:hypothetical protein